MIYQGRRVQFLVLLGIGIVVFITVMLLPPIYWGNRSGMSMKAAEDLCSSKFDSLRAKMALRFFEIHKDLLVPALTKIARDRRRAFPCRLNAILMLGQKKDSQAVVPLGELLNDESEDKNIRGSAAQALGFIGDEKATDYLVKGWLFETSKGVQRENGNFLLLQNIAVAIAKIGKRDASPLFLQTFESNDKNIRLLSAIVLYKLLNDEKYFNIVANGVRDKEYKGRGILILTLGEVRDQRIDLLLKEFLDDENPIIRKNVKRLIVGNNIQK